MGEAGILKLVVRNKTTNSVKITVVVPESTEKMTMGAPTGELQLRAGESGAVTVQHDAAVHHDTEHRHGARG